MLTTTRFCALFICLLRQCRACAYAGGNNSKKIIMITIFFFFLSLSLALFLCLFLSVLSLPLLSFVLRPKRLLSDYLKYLRASQHKIPSVTSRVFFIYLFKNGQANEYDQKLFFFFLILFEIMRQMLNCRA